jgi:hypothetical protein
MERLRQSSQTSIDPDQDGKSIWLLIGAAAWLNGSPVAL